MGGNCCWRCGAKTPVTLALAPFLFPGARGMSVAAKILVFVLLVASYDLLLGYTGIVSFAHTMFFGIGAYGVAIASGPLVGVAARAVVVLDENDNVLHSELVKEIAEEPNYEAALAVLK